MGKMAQLKTRNYLAINAWNRTGAGVHKDKKQELLDKASDADIEQALDDIDLDTEEE